MMWQSSEHSKIAELYNLKCTLGRGHFAVVKLAEHVFSGEKVAIKVIDKTKMDKISADHLYHEVTCMKLVQHPNVVRLYQVIETSSKLYLILELGDGGDMFDYIMRHDKGLHEDLAKEYFAQIVSAIAYCHKLHVVHRDLKPENVVFFETQGLVKLTDFGFSNHYSPGKKLSTSCGSLAYSAPEILLGEEYDAPAVDVWSLGVILYMLVCGVAPFNEANDSETLTNIMDCRYTMMDHVSKPCQDLIQRMIIREPSDRISLSDIVNHPWLIGAKSLGRARRNSIPILMRNSIPEGLHNDIISKMSKANLADEEEIVKALDEDRYDHITSTYFLLAERQLLQQQAIVNAKAPLSHNSDEVQMDGSTVSIKARTTCGDGKFIPTKVCPVHKGMQSAPPNTSSVYSASPPRHKQAAPASAASLLDPARKRTASSSSEESNPSLPHSKNPSFIREHLTITPRHGFSVAHGGIVTLIEEEERSRSQTTTDDECDAGDELGNMLNPNALASNLRSLQMKRIKKRKSAPVLNEIYEENESEGDFTEMEDGDQRSSHYNNLGHVSGRQSIATSTPYSSDRQRTSIEEEDADTFSLDPKEFKSNVLHGVRTGRPSRRRKSQKSSSSETSDEDCESRRASTTNLSDVAKQMLFRRRDSSDDDDGGSEEQKKLTKDALTNAISEDMIVQQEACTDTNQRGGSISKKGQPNGNVADSDGGVVLNNASDLPIFSKKLLNLDGTDHKIINVFGIRSRSAESHSSSSSQSVVVSSRGSSNARSSCSSLSTGSRFRPILNKGGRWVHKNSSSTRSDTGLVLRCHMNNIRTTKNRCVHTPNHVENPVQLPNNELHRSTSSSSFISLVNGNGGPLRVCSSLTCVNRKNLNSDAAVESDGSVSRYRHHRACSLPHRRGKSKLIQKNLHGTRRNTMVNSSGTPLAWPDLHTDSQESMTIKQSNVSLTSSTCSGSKFVVDPLNELPLSPCLAPLPESNAKDFVSTVNNLKDEKEKQTFLWAKHHNSKRKPLQCPSALDNFDIKSKISTAPRRSASKRLGIVTKLNHLKSNRSNPSNFQSEKRVVTGNGKARVRCAIM